MIGGSTHTNPKVNNNGGKRCYMYVRVRPDLMDKEAGVCADKFIFWIEYPYVVTQKPHCMHAKGDSSDVRRSLWANSFSSQARAHMNGLFTHE